MIENKQELLFIDATPTDDYPLRILRAYRERCNELWSSTSYFTEEDNETNPLCVELNKMQKQRAEILDKAIKILESNQ